MSPVRAVLLPTKQQPDGISSESQVSLAGASVKLILRIAWIVQKTWFSAMDSLVPSALGRKKMDAPLFRSGPEHSQPAEFYAAKYDSCGTSRCTHSVVAEADGKPLGIVRLDIYSS